ncbi:hypothetical protein, partial [Bradyrhizobium sp.]|uniref:hypothetical protein n=1 Tax=Bradyrhizobium sp. TaxID=376 RepID=UPI004037EE9C
MLPFDHDGQISSILQKCVKPFAQKKFLFTGIPIYVIHLPSPCHREGRFAIVTKRGAGCDGPLAASGDSMIPEKWVTGFPIRIM